MQTIYIGRDNTFDLALALDDKMKPASDFNRFVLYMRDPATGNVLEIDSNTAGAGTFDSTATKYVQHRMVSVLRCKLGLGAFGLVAGVAYECWLRVYSAEITNGLVWPDQDDTFRLRVVSGP